MKDYHRIDKEKAATGDFGPIASTGAAEFHAKTTTTSSYLSLESAVMHTEFAKKLKKIANGRFSIVEPIRARVGLVPTTSKMQ